MLSISGLTLHIVLIVSVLSPIILLLLLLLCLITIEYFFLMHGGGWVCHEIEIFSILHINFLLHPIIPVVIGLLWDYIGRIRGIE